MPASDLACVPVLVVCICFKLYVFVCETDSSESCSRNSSRFDEESTAALLQALVVPCERLCGFKGLLHEVFEHEALGMCEEKAQIDSMVDGDDRGASDYSCGQEEDDVENW